MPQPKTASHRVEFLDARSAGAHLQKLATWAESISVAVAWAKKPDRCHDALLDAGRAGKVRRFVVGIAFCQTDPDFLDAWMDVKGEPLRIQADHPGTFHPKVYLFQRGEHARILLGSSNFTDGGLGGNTEANVLIHTRGSDEVVKRAMVVTSTGRCCDRMWLEKYREAYERHREWQKHKPTEPPLPDIQSLTGDPTPDAIATAVLGEPAQACPVRPSPRLFSCRTKAKPATEALLLWAPRADGTALKWWFKTLPSVEARLDKADHALVALRLVNEHVLFVEWHALKAGAPPDKKGRRYLDVFRLAPRMIIAREGWHINGFTDPAGYLHLPQRR